MKPYKYQNMSEFPFNRGVSEGFPTMTQNPIAIKDKQI